MSGSGETSAGDGPTETALREARARIAALDRDLMALVAERMRVAARVGEAKRQLGLPVRNFGTEAEVLARYRSAAAAAGVELEHAEALAGLLIEAAVRLQEGAGEGTAGGGVRTVVILGGAGKMGTWFRRFFEGQGHAVRILDPGADAGDPGLAGWDMVGEADIVLVATPLSATAEALASVLATQPRGLVMDIASLKTPILGQLRAAAAAGHRIASLHPLFGPEVRTLAGRVMAICNCGNPGAVEQAAGLFGETAVTITRLDVEEHDRYMQYVLGLSHLVSLLFATTVTQSGLAPGELASVASTTWLKQVRTASEVAAENPRMYFEIQRLNRHSAELFRRVREGLDRLEAAALAEDPAAFSEIMRAAHEFLPRQPGPLLG